MVVVGEWCVWLRPQLVISIAIQIRILLGYKNIPQIINLADKTVGNQLQLVATDHATARNQLCAVAVAVA